LSLDAAARATALAGGLGVNTIEQRERARGGDRAGLAARYRLGDGAIALRVGKYDNRTRHSVFAALKDLLGKRGLARVSRALGELASGEPEGRVAARKPALERVRGLRSGEKEKAGTSIRQKFGNFEF
jgi:hypothetical protein